MNQTIGHIQCPICDTPGEVRRYKGSNRGTMYWACECGQIRPVKSQRYILKHAEFYPDAGELLPTDAKLFTPKKPVTEKPEPATPAAPLAEKPEPKKPAAPVTTKPAPRTAAIKPAAPTTKKPEAKQQRNAWGFYE